MQLAPYILAIVNVGVEATGRLRCGCLLLILGGRKRSLVCQLCNVFLSKLVAVVLNMKSP